MAERQGFFMERGPLGTWGECPPERDRLVEVIGEDSVMPVEGFTPTRYELGILARYYYEMLENVELKGVLDKYETIDGIDECRRDFAWLRLLDIEEVLGEDEYDKVIAKVQRKWDQVFGELLTKRCVSFKHEEEGEWIEVISALRSEIPGIKGFATIIAIIQGWIGRKLVHADALFECGALIG